MPTELYIEHVRILNKIHTIGNIVIPQMFEHLQKFKGAVYDFTKGQFTEEFNKHLEEIILPNDPEIYYKWEDVSTAWRNGLNFSICTTNSNYRKGAFIITMGRVCSRSGNVFIPERKNKILKNPDLKTDFDANFIKLGFPSNDESELCHIFEVDTNYRSAMIDFSSGVPVILNWCNQFSDEELLDISINHIKANNPKILDKLEHKIQKSRDNVIQFECTLTKLRELIQFEDALTKLKELIR